MHGRLWHDHEQPKAFEPEVFAGGDAVPEVESSGQRVGMGKHRGDKPASPGGTRRKRMTPPGKGLKQKKKNG